MNVSVRCLPFGVFAEAMTMPQYANSVYVFCAAAGPAEDHGPEAQLVQAKLLGRYKWAWMMISGKYPLKL